MGQALDKDGNVLAEALGHTKREVFDKLIKEAPDAHEIRIRKLRESMPAFDAEQAVHAINLRIDEIEHQLEVLIAATVKDLEPVQTRREP